MNKIALNAIAADIEAALKGVAEKHSVQIIRGNATYAATSGTLKLEISDIVNGVVEDVKRTAFIDNAKYYVLEAEWLDKEITLDGQRFTVAGLNTRARKNVVLINRVTDGKGFVCSALAVAKQLGNDISDS